MESATIKLVVPEDVDLKLLVGPADTHLRRIHALSPARVVLRGRMLILSGSSHDLEYLHQLFMQLFDLLRHGEHINDADIERYYQSIQSSAAPALGFSTDAILMQNSQSIRPKTPHQQAYISAMTQNTMTFCFGPAGTGKTYLAIAMALSMLKQQTISRIVLTRPVVEAGESLGFLPGGLEEKLDPYVRPLMDALIDLTDTERVTEYLEHGIIEIAPLAYMRGRTLNDAFVILDEAQNTTPEQMKMFLTRLGFNARFVITGDTTQRDLARPIGGLTHIERILQGISDIAFVHLGQEDVIRHQLVGNIVAAYEHFEQHRREESHEHTSA
ncbi:PhoH family protein [Collinsella sp. zg1085]|uniref:PhoH family protein n=1 Tax=Collinsella sp. zg1085 TaxID=2844380 RepID=UPI001C0CA9A3|nr:PhoH family protein [Collinsella sp. zg1085]QWT16981.1 PhoH family protein [Collinsella sp. zg1085]